MEYQITLFCATKKYKPVSCIIKRKSEENLADAGVKKALLADGMKKICITRGWTGKDLTAFGYTTGKVRVYDKAKIEAENAARYEKIKEEKYASGEWKRPSKKKEEK